MDGTDATSPSPAQAEAGRPRSESAPNREIPIEPPPCGAARPPAPPGARMTSTGLPTRVPRQHASEKELMEAFVRSWESTSPETLAVDTGARRPSGDAASQAGEPRPQQPPEPLQPPTPPQPPKPPEPPAPPEPAKPPTPHEPPPTPQPPVPQPPPPRPGPTPPPRPPGPTPPPEPVPSPPVPVPPFPPGPPVPNPPPAPFPVPAPPVPPTPAGMAGVYRGGRYGHTSSEHGHTWAQPTATAAPIRPPVRRAGGTVYRGRTGIPARTNPAVTSRTCGSLLGFVTSAGQSIKIPPMPRRARLIKLLAIGLGSTAFVLAIAFIVATLAGDFIRGLVDTFLK